MQETILVSVLHVKEALNRVFDHILYARLVKDVNLEDRGFWDVDLIDRYNLNTQPRELLVGDIQDAVELVGQISENEIDPIAAHLEQLAPLVRKLGELLSAQLARQGG